MIRIRRAVAPRPFPCAPSYLVTFEGDVYRQDRAAPLRPVLNQPGGYLQVNLWTNGKGRIWFVHHVVAITFHGPRPTPRHHASHRDGVRTHNAADNLAWLSKEENEADKVRHGTSNRGQRNPMSRTSRARRSAT